MTTITANRPTALRLPNWMRALMPVAGTGQRRQPTLSAAELLERAEAYEATQPSYAADLRAAAGHLDSAK